MKILFIGDIFSKSGRNALFRYLPLIKDKYPVDVTIANGENCAHGKGMSMKNYAELKNAGVDIITLGNHFLAREEINNLLKNKDDIVRPLNIKGVYNGNGSIVVDIKGNKIRVTNMLGRVYMRGFEIDNPFYALDDLLDESDELIHIVDFHAEATGEKKSFAKYFDGRVSAVLGTHTHVQTADNQVFKGGSAYISDVGYCGAYDSVLGVNNGDAILFSKDQDYRAHTPMDSEDLEFSAVYLDVDNNSGKTNSIKRIYITPSKQKIELLD